MGSYRKRVEGRDGGNAEIPRHNRGRAGAMLVELALVYIIWERSHMRVTGDRVGIPPRRHRLTVELNHKLALAAIASASYATASPLKAQAVNHKL